MVSACRIAPVLSAVAVRSTFDNKTHAFCQSCVFGAFRVFVVFRRGGVVLVRMRGGSCMSLLSAFFRSLLRAVISVHGRGGSCMAPFCDFPSLALDDSRSLQIAQDRSRWPH